MTKIHILHVIHKLSMGGLENGLVNLVNGLSADRYRHTLLSLTTQDGFIKRIRNPDVRVIEFNKKPGPLLASLLPLYSMISELAPDIIHTRNYSTIECQLPAFFARVPYRIHSEHGRDSDDIIGLSQKKKWIRKSLSPLIHQYVALSKDLEKYLIQHVGIPSHKIKQIYNGVNLKRYYPQDLKNDQSLIVLTAGRLTPVKDIPTLLKAFALLQKEMPNAQLWVAGDGPERSALEQLTHHLQLQEQVRFLGQREDLSQLMAQANIYVQSSLFEGISNTLLEAMASGLPIVATEVGGNSELIMHRQHGFLVPKKAPIQLADAMISVASSPGLKRQLAHASRLRAQTYFDLNSMIEQYDALYGVSREVICVV